MHDRYQPLGLGCEAQRLTVALAVIKQALLIVLNQLKRDSASIDDAGSSAEPAEVLEVALSTDDRRLGVVVNPKPNDVLITIGLKRRHRNPFRGGRRGQIRGSSLPRDAASPT